MMGRGQEVIERAYTGDRGPDNRRDRRIDRARRREADRQAILTEGDFVAPGIPDATARALNVQAR